MEFSPNNPVVKLCLQGMAMEAQSKPEAATHFFRQAWSEAANDFEKFLASFYIARCQQNVADRLQWYETTLQLALLLDSEAVKGALASIYGHIAECHEALGDAVGAQKNQELALAAVHHPADKGPFYHGTRADLQVGDLLAPGHNSNYQSNLLMNHIYFTALPNGAGLAAALARGDGSERVYIVEPTDDFENDPNVTNKKFPGNPTRSYRTAAPLKITGELTEWVRQTPEEIQRWRERLAESDGEIIN